VSAANGVLSFFLVFLCFFNSKIVSDCCSIVVGLLSDCCSIVVGSVEFPALGDW